MRLQKFALIIACLCLTACSSSEPMLRNMRAKPLYTPTGHKLNAFIAKKVSHRNTGLSGVKDEEFPKGSAMLFILKKSQYVVMWMPDTYFDIDIFFLDESYTVTAVERNIPHHPGLKEPEPIYTTRNYIASYVLELRADDPLAKEIRVGDTLKLGR